MPNPTYTVRVLSIATDGTDLFLEVSVSDGTTTFPTIRPTFDANTAASDITAYLQVIASNRPTLPASIQALVNSTVTG